MKNTPAINLMKRSPLARKAKEKSQPWYRKKCVERAKRLAKERDNWICQRCGKDGKNGYQIHGSHIFSEGRYHGLSANILNIKALCAQCHMWWHENPIDAVNWFKERFPERYKKLLILSRTTIQIDWKREYLQNT